MCEIRWLTVEVFIHSIGVRRRSWSNASREQLKPNINTLYLKFSFEPANIEGISVVEPANGICSQFVLMWQYSMRKVMNIAIFAGKTDRKISQQ